MSDERSVSGASTSASTKKKMAFQRGEQIGIEELRGTTMFMERQSWQPSFTRQSGPLQTMQLLDYNTKDTCSEFTRNYGY
jgi:hypothetical protein